MPAWRFLTNHALVLTYISRHPESTGLEIALAVGITERATREIVRDLEQSGYLSSERVGRRKRYSVQLDQSLGRIVERELTVRELIDLLRGRRQDTVSA